MSRYHVIPALIPKGVCYEIETVQDASIHYFKDETAWSNVIGMLQRPWYRRWFWQPWMAWELDADVDAIKYKVWLPSEELGKEFQTKYYGEHPEVEIYRSEDAPWDFKARHAGSKLLLERHYVVPLKIYHNDVVDTQAELIGMLENLNLGERVKIQFLVKPQYRTDRLFGKAFKQLHSEEDDDESMLTENELYKSAIQGKKSRLLARVSMKIIASADSREDARRLIASARHSFGQFSSGELNRIYAREWWQIIRPLFRFEFKRRIYPWQLPKKRVVLAADELAMIMRLPSGKVVCNKLQRMKMRRTPLPLEVKQLQGRKDGTCVPIGMHEYHGKSNEVFFDTTGWSRHMAIWGGTMMGKSTFIYNLLEQIIGGRTADNKTGFTLIDPHGSLAVDVASRIPKEQQHLVRYVRFKDGEMPFNVYDVDFASSPDKIAQNVADVCKRVWKDFWGPNVDDNFLNGGIALQKVKSANLYNLRMVLEDDDFRAEVLGKLKDDDPLERQLKMFLSKYDGLEERIKEPKINSTLNKLRKLTLSGTLGRILRAETNGIRWREGMDEGYYHIFDLSGLTIDERRFVGSMCLTFAQLAMLSREDALSAGKPMPLHPIIVDEAPTFMDQSADAIQSFADEARKYNVPLVLGMQGLEGQVPDQVASAIFRNFGTLIAYRVGNTEDAETIYNGMRADYLKVEDFQRVEPNYAYMRMAIGRETTMPFLVKMNAPERAQYTGDIPEMIKQTVDRALEIEDLIQAEKAAAKEAEFQEAEEIINTFAEEKSTSTTVDSEWGGITDETARLLEEAFADENNEDPAKIALAMAALSKDVEGFMEDNPETPAAAAAQPEEVAEIATVDPEPETPDAAAAQPEEVAEIATVDPEPETPDAAAAQPEEVAEIAAVDPEPEAPAAAATQEPVQIAAAAPSPREEPDKIKSNPSPKTTLTIEDFMD
ncbi:ATPase [Saccharibacillus sp. O16]|nr:ATPase [Saccharibacillus sp. O16]